MKRFLRCALPLPCAEAALLLYGVLTGRMDAAFTAATPLFILGFLALLACTFGYWAAFSKCHPEDRLPRIPTTEADSPDISRWGFDSGDGFWAICCFGAKNWCFPTSTIPFEEGFS